jgi:hypothetical protein
MELDSCAECPVAAPAEVVWDWMWDPANARWFEGYGPVAGVVGAELDELRTGAFRIVSTADGARLREQVLEARRPFRHRYRLTEITGPLSWLVRSGEASWDYRPAGGSTVVAWRYRFELTSPVVWPLARAVVAFFGVAQHRALRRIARSLAGP